jgi:uncharacterized protein (TIGR02118 family)
MILRMGILRKRDGLGTEAFRRHWREVHGPLAAKLPGLRRYHQNHVVGSTQLGIDHARGAEVVDGFSELWFDDVSSMQHALASSAAQALVADEANLLGSLKIIVAEQNAVVPVATDRTLIKRMSLLKRRADVDPATFRHEWQDVHAGMVREIREVEGYTQNLVIGRSLGRSPSAIYDEVPIDGIVELWFRDVQSLEAAFTSPEGKALMQHAKAFIAEITTFLVEVHEVI